MLELNLVTRAVEQSLEKSALVGNELLDPGLDTVLRDQVEDIDRLALAQTMDAGDALFDHGGVPGHFNIDAATGGSLKIQSHPSGIGRK